MSAPAATMAAKLMRIKNPSSNVFDEADIAQRDAAEGFTAALVEAHHSSSSATNSRKPRQWAVIEIRSLAKVTDLGAPALANVGRDKSLAFIESASAFASVLFRPAWAEALPMNASDYCRLIRVS